MPPRIASDLTGVIANCDVLKSRYAERYGLDLPSDCLCTRENVVEKYGLLDHEGWLRFTRWVYGCHFGEAPLVDGARETFLEWTRRGYDPVIISSKPGRFMHRAQELFVLNGLPTPRLYFVGGDEGQPAQMKYDVCMNLGIDILVDDKLAHLVQAIPYVPHLIHLSRDREEHPHIHTVQSLQEVRYLTRALLEHGIN